MADVPRATIKRWDKAGLLSIKGAVERVNNPHSHMDDRHFSEHGLKIVKWLKYMTQPDKNKDFCLKLLLEYIDKGKIDEKDLNWPLAKE
jgi:hypothetical protein